MRRCRARLKAYCAIAHADHNGRPKEITGARGLPGPFQSFHPGRRKTARAASTHSGQPVRFLLYPRRAIAGALDGTPGRPPSLRAWPEGKRMTAASPDTLFGRTTAHEHRFIDDREIARLSAMRGDR